MGEFTLLPKFKPINSDTKGHDFKKIMILEKFLIND